MENEKQLSDSVNTTVVDIQADRPITSARVWLEVKDVMSKNVITIGPEETVVSAAKTMSENNVSCAVVVDNGSLAGILTEKDLFAMIAGKDKNFVKIKVAQVMSSSVDSIPSDLSILDASGIMEAKRIRRLPILEGEQLVGIVTQTDLTRALTSYCIWKDVAEIMSSDMAVVQTKATVAEAAQIMKSRNISCIVALKGNKVQGIITERDLLKRVIAPQKDPTHINVEEVMSSPVTTIPPNHSVFSAYRAMDKMHVRRLVVIENEQLCGIVTQTDILRVTKKKLQEEEERDSQLLEHSKSNIYTLDSDGRITYVNPAFMELLEVSDPAELINQPFLQERFWVNPEERTQRLSQLKKESVEIKELALKTSKGKKIYVTDFSTFTKNIHGHINGTRGILYDITERKRLEEKLHQIEWLLTINTRLGSTQVESYEPSYGDLGELNTHCEILHSVGKEQLNNIVSKQLNLLDTSVSICEVNGDYALGHPTSGWCSLLDQASRNLCGTSNNTEALNCGRWLCHESRWTRASKVSIETGQPVDIECYGGIHIYAVPILAGHEVVGSINIGYGNPPRDTRKLEALSKLYGVNVDELRTRSKAYESRPAFIIDTAKKDLQVSAKLIGEMVRRHRTEKATRLAYEKLENTHKEVTQMQSQMVQNEKLASIGQLAAGVAHEMNTPVGFVASNFQTLENYVKKIRDLLITYGELIGQIETLGKTELRDKIEGIGQFRDELQIDFILEDIQGLFDDSREGLERVTSIVQNLRDFSRVDQPGSRDEYNINKGIETTLVVARNEIKYNADVKTDFSEVPPIFCHSGQINQVFLNILMNAAQAIKSQERDGNGTIAIRTYATETEVVCEISDDGPGIPSDKLSKIFDPFFTTKPAGKGTGLGLSVSYDIIINKHNGEFFVESTVGEGTKFTIKLPICTKENDEQEIMSDGKENSIICR